MKYLPTIFVTLLILVAVLLPGSHVPDVRIVGIDKVAHFGLFAMWVTAVRYDFGDRFKWYWALTAGMAFSVLTEVLQILVEGRSFDLTDIIADICGLAFGLFAGKVLLIWVNRLIG